MAFLPPLPAFQPTIGSEQAPIVAAAILLAAIEYTLGVGLMSLRIGEATATLGGLRLSGVAGFGREMAENGAFSVIVIASLSALAIIAKVMSGMLYPGGIDGAYRAFDVWLFNGQTQAYLTLRGLGSMLYLLNLPNTFIGGVAPEAALVSLINNTIKPWTSLLQATFMMLYVSSTAATIIRSSWYSLAVIGAAVYALPWKVGRGVGATMITVPLVFYIGMPFMPVFVNYFASLMAPVAGMMAATTPCQAIINYATGNPLSWLPAPPPDCDFTATPSNPFAVTSQQWTSFAQAVSPSMNFAIWIGLFLPALYYFILFSIGFGATRLFGASHYNLLGALGLG